MKCICKDLPEEYSNIPVLDYDGKLIIPGMCDMHVHAPQFVYRGHVHPAVTPRFIPTCSTELQEGVGRLAAKYNIPIHSIFRKILVK